MPKQTFFNLTKEKQDQIINAAVSEFSQFSFNEVKISDIVNKARIPRSSFYDYFEDKRDLYQYIILMIREEKMNFMAPALENNNGNFFERFKAIFKAGAKFAAIKPEYEKLARRMYENMQVINDIFHTEDMDVSNFYEDMIIKGIENGELRNNLDIQFIAKSIYILTNHIMAMDFNNSSLSLDEYIDEITDKIVDFIKYGISS